MPFKYVLGRFDESKAGIGFCAKGQTRRSARCDALPFAQPGMQQGRKQPSGAACILLTITRTNPKVLLEIAPK